MNRSDFPLIAMTKRAPAVDADGKIGAVAVYHSQLYCTPLYPNTGEQAIDPATGTAFASFRVLVWAESDIRHGDVFTVNGKDYEIVGVQAWPWLPGVTVTELGLNARMQDRQHASE